MTTTSARQIAANRSNAAKSTGPRTGEGRAVSKMNALKHGILSRQVLVRGLILQESEAELEALHQRFRDEFQPEGPLEELLVDQIVTAHWRLRRALSAESGEIALNMDSGHRRRSRRPDLPLLWMKWMAVGDPVHAMEGSATGNTLLLEWLREVRDSVAREGTLTGAAVEQLKARFGGKPNSLAMAVEDFRLKMGESPLGDTHRMETLAFLNRRICVFRCQLERCEEEEAAAEEAKQAAAILPSGEVLDKILRYETKLERQMYRAMAQLERVQRMRRGETIPAPLPVEVSERG